MSSLGNLVPAVSTRDLHGSRRAATVSLEPPKNLDVISAFGNKIPPPAPASAPPPTPAATPTPVLPDGLRTMVLPRWNGPPPRR